ncbi:FAD/NAD(P)-binding protein [Sphingobacterium bambusae]|uniref:FAD/NAD(P)-binding protein n=1 Tax=Sphingobacterium bambusae TaxID=662858 RepID=A0ABW6BI01_9SPHI|nr:FAD/NAD(P)-binding protein [Sphingobacterium bambusae]WPL47564.1 FAD/NAD(P)-binding protein [Sphingobacterium bambusae]
MIWKNEHICAAAKGAKKNLQDLIEQSNDVFQPSYTDEVTYLGIVGGGPKGFYALERLFAQVQAQTLQQPIVVYWFNESPDFGCGPNYQVDQPNYLLINYCVGNIDAWNREDCNTAVAEQLNLRQWIQKNKRIETEVAPTDYASRALVGCYLQDQLKALLASRPTSIGLRFVVSRVRDIAYQGLFEIMIDDKPGSIRVEHLLLATGHCYHNKSLLANIHAEPKLDNYFDSAYPVQKLNAIPPDEPVGVIGLGLTFIDVVLQLTEGRGGQFNENGEYIASGTEPHIYACSRNNIPILPRGPIYGENRYQLREQTSRYLKGLAQTNQGRKIDFETEIYPLLRQEAQFAYYSTLLSSRDEDEVTKYMHTLDQAQIFHLEDLLFPQIAYAKDQNNAVLSFLEDAIAQAKLGELHSPILAASAVWREATPLIGEIYAHGGLTGKSQAMLEHNLWSAFCRTSFGPPVENMKKVVALAKAGIVHFANAPLKTITYDDAQQQFMINTQQSQLAVNYLIDARIARGKLQDANSALHNALLKNKLIQPFDNDGYQSGGPALHKSGQAITTPLTSDTPLFFYGTATEGTLLDNDSLSRKRNDTASPWAKSIIQQLLHKQKNALHESYSQG